MSGTPNEYDLENLRYDVTVCAKDGDSIPSDPCAQRTVLILESPSNQWLLPVVIGGAFMLLLSLVQCFDGFDICEMYM